MANNYSQATVSPVLPVALVTDFEIVLLNAYGFHFETHVSNGERSYYFYVSDGESDELDHFDLDLIEEYAKQDDELALDLRQYILENGDCDIDQHISFNYSWPSLFQRILNKSGCTIDEIVVEGVFYCDKLRQGEFGGWITRITRFTVQHGGTQAMLIQMQQESAFLEALDTVYQLASANCADNEHDPEDPLLDECLSEDCRKQRAALDLIHDYYVNHELNR
ncbi:MAG: hypothetical protein Q8K07_15040 [Methylicorpusculum sp.]|uniref:hypothetical protein n=1 Tax=Methylicorpusculum sp. TaxID=2713644 RepID=UPI0027316C24|nr:hypothetical protein [Methylicorpusculum sp.]MDP2203338.1 hypothetical protein [Methylicorpusculum sp.]